MLYIENLTTAVPLDVCEQQVHNDLYFGARKGLLKKYTGISESYYLPEKPDI